MSADIKTARSPQVSAVDITADLVQWVARHTDTDAASVDPDRPLTASGLDSVKAAELITLLSDRFGIEITAERLFDGATITDIAANSPTADPVPDTPATPSGTHRSLTFSLLFFSSDAERGLANPYQLLLDSAAIADKHRFEAIWLPERHFHRFGGLFPNPSVVGAALAAHTQRIRIRAGSVVLPLHNPVRVAEEWAVVDNLSGGRVDLAFATGWNVDDFALSPAAYADRGRTLAEGVDTVRRLWRGESLTLPNGHGEQTPLRIFPAPQQPQLQTWLTCTGNPERFRQAGALGANLLTALLFQEVDELAPKLRAYREARAEHGFDPQTGRVTLMLHTFLGTDAEQVRRTVETPFKRYLADSVDLWKRGSATLADLTPTKYEQALAFAFERYYRTSALFGTPDTVTELVNQLRAIGVDEIACLVDFGIPDQQVRQGLLDLATLADRYSHPPTAAVVDLPPDPDRESMIGEALRDRHTAVYRNTGGVLRKVQSFELTRRMRAAELLPFYTELSENEGATCRYNGRELIMLGSNNYLGLTADRRVRRAVATSAMAEGPSLTGSRLLNGSTAAQTAFERRLADFLGRADALLFTTGYQANIGLLSAVMGPDTVLVADEECHASIYDGAAVGRCEVLQFRHNDPDNLSARLQDLGSRPAMVMVDGVYSMSGELAPLRELRAVCNRYDVPLAVDDAHGLGMLGTNGRGIEEATGTLGAADVLTGTFSKSLASVGGWLAGDKQLVEWIRYHGRSVLFSAAIPPTALAAADAALDIMVAEPWRLERLRENANYWRAGLSKLGFVVGRAPTAIVPIPIGSEMACLRFAKVLLAEGVYANCVVAPAVATDQALIRTSVTAVHERHHLDGALEAFERAGRATGLLS
ncbi:MupA/Atu3671 family FMN-dependent luciferase-like monooxygenase [Nocardia sp. NPDC050793]|uniref:MupA/Atu3671 family FMN-dependent luciferase-like monooxygenase n=1 Tax=Nocardia sp. NPDC050793 TaxID=3155159 RepID=UPI0033C07C64